VVPEMLNFIKSPDIASIPQTNEEYNGNCHKLPYSSYKPVILEKD
jgi:hypothetical protein